MVVVIIMLLLQWWCRCRLARLRSAFAAAFARGTSSAGAASIMCA